MAFVFQIYLLMRFIQNSLTRTERIHIGETTYECKHWHLNILFSSFVRSLPINLFFFLLEARKNKYMATNITIERRLFDRVIQHQKLHRLRATTFIKSIVYFSDFFSGVRIP